MDLVDIRLSQFLLIFQKEKEKKKELFVSLLIEYMFWS